MNKFHIGDKVRFKTTGEITTVKSLYYDEIRKKFCYIVELKDYIVFIEDDFDLVREGVSDN